MTTDERIENLEKGLASARRFNRWLLAAVGLALGVWILAGTFGPTMAAAPAQPAGAVADKNRPISLAAAYELRRIGDVDIGKVHVYVLWSDGTVKEE